MMARTKLEGPALNQPRTDPESASQHDSSDSRHSVITDLWSNYNTVRRWLTPRLPTSIARQTDADDVMQEAFVEACRHADKLTDKESKAARNWLSLVARRKLIDRIRRANSKRRKAVEANCDSPDQSDIPALTPTPSSFLARREAEELLANALSQLPDQHRTVIQLRFFEDRTFHDVSKRMGISDVSAQRLSKRALRKLRELLDVRSQRISN